MECPQSGGSGPVGQLKQVGQKSYRFLGRWTVMLLLICEYLALLAMCILISYLHLYKEGFGLTEALGPRNHHALWMSTGLFFFFTSGVLVYRMLPILPYEKRKTMHAILMILSFVLMLIGFSAILYDRINGSLRHFGTMHSWLGLALIVMFSSQTVLGLATFWYPSVNIIYRSLYKPIHVYWGWAMYGLSAAAIGTGTTLYLFDECNPYYKTRPIWGYLGNFFVIVVIATCTLASYLATRNRSHVKSISDYEPLLDQGYDIPTGRGGGTSSGVRRPGDGAPGAGAGPSDTDMPTSDCD